MGVHNFSHRAGTHQVPGLDEYRIGPLVEIHGKAQLGMGLCHRVHFLYLLGVYPGRLFHQRVQPGVQGLDC